jgi:5-deoxy-glucuronate isomerase
MPNDLPAEQLRLRSDEDGRVAVDPQQAGWRYLSFRALRLADGETVQLPGDLEHGLVVIEGPGAMVEAGGRRLEVDGRPSPFAALPCAAYVPAGMGAAVSGSGTLVAIGSAPSSGQTETQSEPVLIGRDEIKVEVRGRGNATRQVNHIIEPAFPADRLLMVEVLTPSGNWSSWPPHKHDVDDMPTEAVLEETYYYRFRRPEAWAIQRLYRPDRSRDCLWSVGTGDVVLVTDGFHPFVTAHGDDAYYLNALAGDRRTMACSFDPDLDWVRDDWAALDPDPRVPLVSR